MILVGGSVVTQKMEVLGDGAQVTVHWSLNKKVGWVIGFVIDKT